MSEREPVFKTPPKARLEKLKAVCRMSVRETIREAVSYDGLSGRTRKKIIDDFGLLWEEKGGKSEDDISVDELFDYEVKTDAIV